MTKNNQTTNVVKKNTPKKKKVSVRDKITTPSILPPPPFPPSQDEEDDEGLLTCDPVTTHKEHRVVSPLLKSKPPIEITETHRSLFNKMLTSGLLDNISEEDIDALAQASAPDEEDDEEEQSSNGDLFVVETQDFNGLLVKEVHLPKFLKTGTRLEEKGNLYFTFMGEPQIYEQLMKLVAGKKMKPLTVALCVPTTKPGEVKVATKIVFPHPVFMAIDFGNFARKRDEPRELKIEIDFTTMVVNDTEFEF